MMVTAKTLRILCMFIILSLSMPAGAAERQFSNISTSNSDLPSDAVRTLCQDSRGYIWIGTTTGVCRFDGVHLLNFSKEDLGLSSSFVLTITEDSYGSVWVSTSSGISCYDYKKASFEPFLLETESGESITHQANTIICDKNGVMWFSVNTQGLFKYDRRKSSLEKFPLKYRRFLFDEQGRLWMSSYYQNLFMTDQNLSSVVPVNLDGDSSYFENDLIQMMSIGKSNPNLLYVASLSRGLNTIDINTGKVTQLYVFPKNAYLNSAFLEGEDRWWAATSDGVFCYDLHSGEVEILKKGSYIFTSIIDKEGGLWIGSKDGGVYYCSSRQDRFEIISSTQEGESLKDKMISGFAEDGEGRIWVTSEKGGLYLLDADRRLHKVSIPELPTTLASPVLDGKDLWLGSLDGIYRVRLPDLRVKAYGPLPTVGGILDPRVYNVIKTSDGSIYAAATRGISKYDADKDSFFPIESAGTTFFTDIVEGEDGVLWLPSFYTGLSKYNPTENKITASFSEKNGLPDDRVCSVCIDSYNSVWAIGFSSGFSKLNEKDSLFVVKNRSSVESLTSDIFYQALEDRKGRLWLSSGNGLVLFNPKSSVAKVFRKEDGLLNSKFTNSALKCSNGDFLFGSDNGFIIVNPYSQAFSGGAPMIQVTEMRVGPSSVPGDVNSLSEKRLKPYENSFSFSVASPGYYSLAGKAFQYMLEGYGTYWENVPSDGSFSFFNVPSGQYKLKFRSSDSAGVWYECHKPLNISIRKRFFATFSGILTILGILAVILSAASFYSYKTSEKKRKKKDEEYRKMKDEEMFYEKMNFFSHVVHEIKTPLTLIQTPLEEVLHIIEPESEVRHDLEVVHSNTEYLSDLVNELLEFVRVEKHGYILNKQAINLSDRVSSLIFNYSETASAKGIKLIFEESEANTWIIADSSALNKILNNLILNAIKYAQSFARISFEPSVDDVVLKIKNDGAYIPEEQREEIFKPFVRYSSSGNGFGIGLPLARSLAMMHSGSLLLDEGKATCFVLRLPAATAPDNDQEGALSVSAQAQLPTLLVIDDNEAIRSFLQRKLSALYNVCCFDSATAALRHLSENNADLIITDITMNGMNGLDFCRTVREDIENSHIPIIVLSARASVESKIQAMESGADLYVEKPFNLDFLKVSIENIIERRALLKKAISSASTQTDIKLFGLPNRDEEFFRKLNETIDNNLSSSELNNSFLASSMAVSEATLIRKIKKMLDTTPVDYIRSKRLNAAVSLLRQGNANITEIAYEVGFSSLAYFSKCFKDRFGCSPSEFVAK